MSWTGSGTQDMSEISLPLSPSLLVYACKIKIKKYVRLKGITLIGSAHY